MKLTKRVETAEPGQITVRDIEVPKPGENDVLVRMRACGICGSDVTMISSPRVREAPTPLGHEPAGEVVEVGNAVVDIQVGDRVVINPMAAPSGIIGNGGALGALTEYLLIENAMLGVGLNRIPDSLPFTVAALNEPMAVARHFVNRANPGPEETAIVFGAGPIGLGAVIWLKLRGVKHVVVADVVPSRLELALEVGADAVINSAQQDVGKELTKLHGAAMNGVGQPRPATDIYLDAAGVGVVLDTAISNAKLHARLVMVAGHRQPESIDTAAMLMSELTFSASLGYPTEIFEVTEQIAEHADLFAKLISHEIPFTEVERAIQLALTPGAADKIVITFP
ncbi:MAG: oxidoreductase, zinc-binding dehydrogenase family protein [Microbacteriaceae bacterium]|nr:oxidoreductase, zinc-binding dehydrogenase family protein [Microbacteriaceae bacterium]